MPALPKPIHLAHQLIRNLVKPSDNVVDATLGNGHDALFLAGLVGEKGCVIGVDIQLSAIECSTQRMIENGMDHYDFHFTGHENMEQVITAKNLPLIFPFLFVTIACGAISGFHCLVSSGTSSKQLKCESDAKFVGYGSMLTEGFLAVLVILACVAGLGLGFTTPDGTLLTGIDAWNTKYADWGSSKGLGAKVSAFVVGASNFLTALGFSKGFSLALMGVFVASFAATTLDTACRLQRYVMQELIACFITRGDQERTKPHPLTNKHFVTIIAIVIAFGIASIPALPGSDGLLGKFGSGGVILWPLFGAINQLLAGLAFLVILFWMKRKNLPIWFVAIPTVFMLIIPAWAMLYQVFVAAIGSNLSWIEHGQWLLVGMGLSTIVLEIWMIWEAILGWKKLQLDQV